VRFGRAELELDDEREKLGRIGDIIDMGDAGAEHMTEISRGRVRAERCTDRKGAQSAFCCLSMPWELVSSCVA
jgi:hypothetical protein